MEDMSLKDLLLSEKYQRLKGYHITQDDVLDFYVLYHEFSLLEKKYHQMVLGRKAEAGNLVAKLEFLEEMIEIISSKIKTKKGQYEEATSDLKDASIKDYSKLFEVLKMLASTESTQYDIKTFVFPAYHSSERHGYRTDVKYTGTVAVLAERKSLSSLESSIKGYISREKLLELYQQGYSMILTGNDDSMTDYDLPNKYALGNLHPIVFYLQDDELAKAAISFLGFVSENGVDIDDIGADDLVKTIKSRYQKTIDLRRIYQ